MKTLGISLALAIMSVLLLQGAMLPASQGASLTIDSASLTETKDGANIKLTRILDHAPMTSIREGFHAAVDGASNAYTADEINARNLPVAVGAFDAIHDSGGGTSMPKGNVTTKSYSVSVPIEDVIISGPETGTVSISYTFTANVSPVSATWPITYVWRAIGRPTVTTHPGGDLSDTATFTWTLSGLQNIVVTATNGVNTVTDTRTITIRQAAATFPFHDGFDSDALIQGWSVITTAQGRVRVSSDHEPYSGTYHVLLDDMVEGDSYSTATLILTINLADQSDVSLDFWWRGFNDEPHPGDGVFIRDDDSASWGRVFSFNDGSGKYKHECIDLDDGVSVHGFVFNEHFQIMFQFYDDSPIPGDGYAIDEIWVMTSPVPVGGVVVSGSVAGAVDIAHTFTATVSPISATQPITYAWWVTGQPAETTRTGGGLSDTATFTWTSPGAQVITVTVTNVVTTVTGTHVITVWPVAATGPFHDGFESGALVQGWTAITTAQGRVRVISDHVPYSGTYHALLDDVVEDATYSTAALILTINLAGQSNVSLDFWWRGFLDEPHPEEDGVFIRDNEGTSWSQVISFTNGPDEYKHEEIDLDKEVAANGLAFNDHFQIKFQFYDNGPIPGDGYAIDEVRVVCSAPATVAITGPVTGIVGIAYPFVATVSPTTTAKPITYSWQATGRDDVVKTTDAPSHTVPFTWNTAGPKTITVTVTPNTGDLISDTHYVTIIKSYKVYLPVVVRRWPPIPDVPKLYPIHNPDCDGYFAVRWSAITPTIMLPVTYILEKDPKETETAACNFTDVDVKEVYVGPETSYYVSNADARYYCYRVRARNSWGYSGWSNVKEVGVWWEDEDNDLLTQANGPLISGSYRGYPDDLDDYFKICLHTDGQIDAVLTSHTGRGWQFLLYDQWDNLIWECRDWQKPSDDKAGEITCTVTAGCYFLRIYTESGHNSNSPYTLQMTFP